jgi:photosystem II stability/assembly factor-like uncharacterized protein
MKNVLYLLLPVIILTGAITIYTYPSGSSSNPAPMEIVSQVSKPEDKGPGAKQAAQKEMFEREVLMTQDPSLGYIPKARLLEASTKARMMQMRNTGTSALVWAERGPNNMGGRTRAIIIDRNDATGNTVLAGSVSGGLWRTTNFKSATPSWTNVSTVSANLAITALAQDPSNFNTMYAGTGEGFSNIDAVRGLGIYKSNDGGLTWELIPSSTTGGAQANDFYYIQKVLVYSNGHVYASAIGRFCNSGGIFKSTDGGTSWTRVIGTYDGSGSCAGAFDFAGYDLEMSRNGDLYATVIDRGNSFTAPATSDTTHGKIYRSPAGINVGNSGTWVNVTPPPPAAAGSLWERIEVSCSQTNNNTIYAVLQGMASDIGGIRVSTDAGTTWTSINYTSLWCDGGSSSSSDFSRGQAWYDLLLGVKPDNDQVVFVGGVDIVKTTNGGASWSHNTQWAGGCGTMPVVHADHHNVFFFPGSPNEMIMVNDGGIYYSADAGVTYTNKSSGYNTIQYYYGAVHPTSGSNYMLAGAQDNGTHKFSTIGLGSVTTATGGDGGYCFIDQDDPNIQVTAYTNCYYNISRDGGANFNVNAHFGANGRFINPTDYDNTNNMIFAAYTGGRVLRVSNVASGTVSGSAFTSSAATTSRIASALKVDPNVTGKVWVAFSGGGLAPVLTYMSNAHTTPAFTTITLPAAIAANHYISSIDVKSGDAARILLSVSNYGVASIYESTDGGVSWTALDANGVNIPDMPVRWAMYTPDNGIMLATELGVWTAAASAGTSTTWTQSAGLPNVRVDMIDYRSSDQTVIAATHGRGVFTTTISSALPVTLLDFSGRLSQDEVVLNWSTSQEINSKDFTLEKSTDGHTYYPICVVKAAGNSSSTRTYSFTDRQVLSLNYYRLRMSDMDGKQRVSNVVLIRTGGGQNLHVVNNPFRSYLDLRLAKPAKTVRLQLVNTAGAVVADKTFNGSYSQLRWEVPSSLSAGTYVLISMADGELFQTKLVKQ